MAVNNFDRIAPVYDSLARLVFGSGILKSQIRFLDHIEWSDRVLILGGGTGELLEYLPKCRQVDFVEKSDKMIARAKSRAVNQPVHFILKDFFEFDSTITYDVILCPFFLDCFNQEYLENGVKKLRRHLKKGGKLIVSDFDEKETGRILSSLMHLFFNVSANLQSKRLKEIHSEIITNEFSMIREDFFNQNMIFSRLYRNL